ncbi:MAG: AAA family ATPase [Methylophilus sp.]|nr:AAA family ATPase [Methylophilus sp.]
MSVSGLRSNRGDIYQTLVAFDWALFVLTDPQFDWLEVDSTQYDVDDVVIGKSDGTIICCQCKKNQPDFRAWSLSDLSDEIQKAANTLENSPNVNIRFYSRGEFGQLAKLREFAVNYSSEAYYLKELTKEHTETNNLLTQVITKVVPNLTSYQFLIRTSFNIDHDYDQKELILRERLRNLASRSDLAFNAVWTQLDLLGGHISVGGLSVSPKFRLTKCDLKEIILQSGAVLAPPMEVTEVQASFSRTSAIGRNWQRDISGQSIQNKTVSELLVAINDKKRAVLLTGLPGSGKTCVMLSLQEALEQRAKTENDLIPLFIQSREFADFSTASELQAQGLPNQWVEQAARLAEHKYVVIVIDSLDVLSIAREHSVLTYFLAQIDQLLRIPNLSVVTACRDFDRRYDYRIVNRTWDWEVKCLPLDWEKEVLPLLSTLSIDSTAIDVTTRALIQNPRELALFVELAQRGGSFNIVTSQGLAQRYLEVIVQADPSLGDIALQAIEQMAKVMLQTRSLSIPSQQFKTSSDILRKLRSLNVIQDTHDGKITFGHQTLLDVLVISGAIRQGVTLNQFIQTLPPVPFVRPSIRSFVAQLAIGERPVFRKQIRAVFTSNAAFHIRRLVAEYFSQLNPNDEDWRMLLDLRNNHREIFQVIYQQASSIEWHYFWFKHLVPVLKVNQDEDGLTAHVYKVAQWKNDDANGVLAFWMESLATSWLNSEKIASQLEMYLADVDDEHLLLATTLLNRLLVMPKPRHSFLGATVARFVEAGAISDDLLWQYMTSEIDEESILQHHFGNKLRCQPHEFGSKKEQFLSNRMLQSTALLDLALSTVEYWGEVRINPYGNTRIGFREGYLSETSYSDAHTQMDIRHVDSERILFNAIEAAILYHAHNNSQWWSINRERLCFNHEGALCYFGILAITRNPQTNIDVIGRLLSNRDLLEFSLSFEIANLIKSAFIYLDEATQDVAIATMLNIWHEDEETDEDSRWWKIKRRLEFISAVPCQLRTEEAQRLIDSYEKTNGRFILQADIGMRSGTVAAPFSYEVFLNASDTGILNLLAHYTGYGEGGWSVSFIGGEREVGWQLREASSRQPVRFLKFLSTYWPIISSEFCDEIMDGAASYLAYRYGNLSTNGTWEPQEEPSGAELANDILLELERHPIHWMNNRSAAKALEACSHVIEDIHNATRLAFLAVGFSTHVETIIIIGDAHDFLTSGLNMKSGNVADALMVVAINLLKNQLPLPVLLQQTLCRFSRHDHPAVRAMILRRLAYFQSFNPTLGWDLFENAMQDSKGLWKVAEPCLYYAYHKNFDVVSPFLERIRTESSNKDMEIWGRITALATLTGHINFTYFLDDLNDIDITDAWEGATSVWTHSENIKHHREICLAGIEAALNAPFLNKSNIANLLEHIFRDNQPLVVIPLKLIQCSFEAFERDEQNKYHRLFGFSDWLNAVSHCDPELALSTAEIYLAYIKKTNPHFYDHDNQLTQLMTRLFGEAEEREEYDNGSMLNRVVLLQDGLLSIGLNSVNEWLQSAERS